MSSSLPHRPWWRDDVTLAWRTDSSVVVGDGVRRVQVNDVHHELIAWLLTLQGQWTLDEALARAEAQGLGRAQPRRLLRSIAGTGGLDDASVAAPVWRDAGNDLRDRLAVERSAIRHAYGQAQRADDVMASRLSARVAIAGSGPVAEAVGALLTASGVGGIVSAQTVRSTSLKGRRIARRIDCQILCELPHAESTVDTESLALDVPHLPISVHGAQASVGPLVLPGRTGCLRCRDLHRVDADRHWSRVAVQLEQGLRTVASAALVQAAAAWGVLHVLTLIDVGPADVTSGGIEWTLTMPHADMTSTTRPQHPLCGCRWWAA